MRGGHGEAISLEAHVTKGDRQTDRWRTGTLDLLPPDCCWPCGAGHELFKGDVFVLLGFLVSS